MIDPLFCQVPTVTGSDDKQLQRELGPKCLHFSIHPCVLAAATAANRIAAYIILTHGPNIISFGRGEYIRLLPSTLSHHVLSSSCPVSLFLIPIWLCLFSWLGGWHCHNVTVWNGNNYVCIIPRGLYYFVPLQNLLPKTGLKQKS